MANMFKNLFNPKGNNDNIHQEITSLNNEHKTAIKANYYEGFSVEEIVEELKIPDKLVREFVEAKLIKFKNKEGKRILEIITKNFGRIPNKKLIEMIVTKNVELQEKICCDLLFENENEYRELKRFFLKYEESRDFFEIDYTLSMEAKKCIRAKSLNDVENLSFELKKTQKVVRNYFLQYYPDESLKLFYTQEKLRKIQSLAETFKMDEPIPHTTYRIVVSEPFDNLIENSTQSTDPSSLITRLLPLVFYYLKCSLQLDEISEKISKLSNILLTTLDLFHLVFQTSDPIVRGLCIEHYSFSNSIPFYYSRLEPYIYNNTICQFEICSELWYSVQQFNGLVSFGLGWASWNPIGKSHLLDLMFNTDFVKGSPQNSPFHFGSIDIQMTNNLYGNKGRNFEERTEWAYIDCHGYSDINFIQRICQNLDIALIHVTYFDFQENFSMLVEDLQITWNTKYVYILVRDHPCDRITTKRERFRGMPITIMFIPHLLEQRNNSADLIELGFEILHMTSKINKLVDSSFLGKLMMNLEKRDKLKKEDKLVKQIVNQISRREIKGTTFSALSYYSYYIDFMKKFYKVSKEEDQNEIAALNRKCKILNTKLKEAKISRIVEYFNDILSDDNSTIILWKLAQELRLSTRKYNLEIFWREVILSFKYHDSRNNEETHRLINALSSNFSTHVERGEPFELIDGDNLRFFNQDINALLGQLYVNQFSAITMTKKRAPIVISIFGPQSSGKSTLLNYCFGCKFLTSAGRCTKGVYASLSKLSQPINHSDHFLILDTEGLDSIERGEVLKETSCIEFDRTMVLFCLAVSQVVIINLRGDLGEDLKNLLKICALSLNKLKVSKVPAPNIFFVLNQQADPDPKKHLVSINTLLNDLNTKDLELKDEVTEGLTISDLIQVSKDNFFVLPSAFNSASLNTQMTKLFECDLIKLSPTVNFANKCADLRMSIIQQLKVNKTPANQTQFATMSEWMEMSGVIWDTIVKYQDIVKYRNIDELKCSIFLNKILHDTLKNEIYFYKDTYENITKDLLESVKKITKWKPPIGILTDIKIKLDEVFENNRENALIKFDKQCQEDKLIKRMNHMSDDTKLNLNRLIRMERKFYEDKLRFEIKARLTEIKISENMEKFQKAIDKNTERYIKLNMEEQKTEFDLVWLDCFGDEDESEYEAERDAIFDDLYSVFIIESKTMENKQTISSLFHQFNFDMSKIIENLRKELIDKFCDKRDIFADTEQFIYPCKENKATLKQMMPYPGQNTCKYLSKDSFWEPIENPRNYHGNKINLRFREWVPLECHSLLHSCSGYYNDPDIIWMHQKRKQILLLASQLNAPDNFEMSTWYKLISDIAKKIEGFFEDDPNISHSIVKEIVNYLCHICRVVNHEINYIEANLTNAAERRISTYAFAFALKFLLESKKKKHVQKKSEEKQKKKTNQKYFLQKVEYRKLARAEWDREEMRKGDKIIAHKFAEDYLEAVCRLVRKNCMQKLNEEYFNDKVDRLSHKHFLLVANEKIMKELGKDYGDEQIAQDNFVTQFMCNRIQILRKMFQEEWLNVTDELRDRLVEDMEKRFTELIKTMKLTLTELLQRFVADDSATSDRPKGMKLDSDSNFAEISKEESASNSDYKIKMAPLKSMVIFLKMYLDPKVNPEEFAHFFSNPFEIDGILMEKNITYKLDGNEKSDQTIYILDEYSFQMLTETKMFSNSEIIFNIKVYVEEFLRALNCYEFKISQDDYESLLKTVKEHFEARIINCPEQCPSCGKFCEKEIHPHEGKCQVMTGHQISSMGGKVWNTNEEKTAILLMCEDYKDYTPVIIPGMNMKWSEFKGSCGDQWDWNLPKDESFNTLQMENRGKMEAIWNKFGPGILQYYANKGTQIKYIPYTSSEEIYLSLFSPNSYVCFVIDATNLMGWTILKVKKWVIDLMKDLEGKSFFKVIVYQGYRSCMKCVEMFPNNQGFTLDEDGVKEFIKNIKTDGDETSPFPMLHGLANAVSKTDWKLGIGVMNSIVHFYIEPTNGYCNIFSVNGECEETGCSFEWETDIKVKMKELKIKYQSDIRIKSGHPDFKNANFKSSNTTAVKLDSEKGCKAKTPIFINYQTDS